MRQPHVIIISILASLATVSLCQQDQTDRPVLSKCCGPGQTLEMPSLECRPVPPPSSSPSPQLSFPETLEPPFLSQLLSQDEFYPEAPPFAMSVGGMPKCDPDREDVRYVVHEFQ